MPGGKSKGQPFMYIGDYVDNVEIDERATAMLERLAWGHGKMGSLWGTGGRITFQEHELGY